MIVDVGKDKKLLKIVECPLCGAEHGEDYHYYARHLELAHTIEDVGLEPLPQAEDSRRRRASA